MAREQSTEIEQNKSVMFRIAPSVDKLMEIYAAQNGMSKSQAINRAIRKFLGLPVIRLSRKDTTQ